MNFQETFKALSQMTELYYQWEGFEIVLMRMEDIAKCGDIECLYAYDMVKIFKRNLMGEPKIRFLIRLAEFQAEKDLSKVN